MRLIRIVSIVSLILSAILLRRRQESCSKGQ